MFFSLEIIWTNQEIQQNNKKKLGLATRLGIRQVIMLHLNSPRAEGEQPRRAIIFEALKNVL